MRVIFMGTPEFSAVVFERLIEAGHDVCLAVTQPDKPKGRGGKMQPTPVKEAAERHGIPVFQPKRVRKPECIEELRKYNADVITVAAFGQILPREILQMTPYGCINVHTSLLPAYRGAAPVQWALIRGEKTTGVTTMQMDEGLDTGDILMQRQVSVSDDDTGGSLLDRLAKIGADLLTETLQELSRGSLIGTKQGESLTPYAKMLDKKMGDIDFGRPAKETERLVRALDPWPGAYTHWQGRALKIWKAKAAPSGAGDMAPGTVTKVCKDHIAVRTGDGELLIYEMQLPGKKKMDAAAFLRGCRIEEGTIFTKECPSKGE